MAVQKNKPRVVHLPVYPENAYQPMLMEAQKKAGWDVIDGGGGGNFLRSVVRRWRPDILHMHWLHPYLLRQGRFNSWLRGIRLLQEIRLIRLMGTRIVWTVHNLVNHDQTNSDIELKLTRRFVRQCDLILTHGNYAATAAKNRFQIPGSVPIHSTRFPSYSDHYETGVTKSEARETLGIPSDAFVVGFLGRVEPYKQVVELVEAFRTSVDEQGILLIGGKASDEYARKVNDAIDGDSRIRFRNQYVSNDGMAEFLRSTDIVACTSKGILTSSSVPLAMSYGRVVIAPSEGCIPEEVGDTGYLFDGSQQGLRQAIASALQEQSKLQERGLEALERAQESSPQTIAQQILEQYQRVLDRRMKKETYSS